MKRRRLNDSSSTLSKPFKSPLIHRKPVELSAPAPAPAPAPKSLRTSNLAPNQSEAPEPGPEPEPERESFCTTTPKRLSIRSSPLSSPPTRPPSRFSPTNTVADPEFVALQKQHSALLSQLSSFRQQLDIAQQAVKLTQSKQDIELQNLITKWKSTSRDAAEEVFRNARDKINRMGGVGAWRERTNKKPEGWDDGEEIDLAGLTDEQKEEVEFRKQEMAEEAEKYGLNRPDRSPESEDDTFTMEMMLKSMNIELGVLGYDTDNQRWSD